MNNNANAVTAEECLEQCNSNSECKLWDIDAAKVCRLRSDKGSDVLVDQSGSSYGQKYCIFSKFI